MRRLRTVNRRGKRAELREAQADGGRKAGSADRDTGKTRGKRGNR